MSKYLILILFVLIVCSPSAKFPSGSDKLKFNSELWKSSIKEYYPTPTYRQKMLKDLCLNILPNETKKEIIDLLGPSLETGYFKSYKWDLIYVTGANRDTYGVDSEWLLIFFDKNNKFLNYKIEID